MVIPITPSVFSKLGIREIGDEVGHRHVSKMEYCPEKHRDGIDGTELNMMMANGPMLISTASLIVFGVVQEDSEYLLAWSALRAPMSHLPSLDS
jgi:hypothetical protein